MSALSNRKGMFCTLVDCKHETKFELNKMNEFIVKFAFLKVIPQVIQREKDIFSKKTFIEYQKKENMAERGLTKGRSNLQIPKICKENEYL